MHWYIVLHTNTCPLTHTQAYKHFNKYVNTNRNKYNESLTENSITSYNGYRPVIHIRTRCSIGLALTATEASYEAF